MTPSQQNEKSESQELLKSSRFRVIRIQESCRDGSHYSRDLIMHPGSVAIVPLLDNNTVCLIKVFRRAVGRTLVEIPAGTLDRVESLEAAAARELTEETGYRAESIEAVGGLWMSPGILRERMQLFIARGLTPGPQALEPGEQIKTLVVAWDEAVEMCLDGRIEDAKSAASILLIDQRRKRH